MTWEVLQQCKQYVENNRQLIFGNHTLSVGHNYTTLVAFQFVIPE